MKVGVLQFFSWPERRVPLEQVYARALQRIEVMDRSRLRRRVARRAPLHDVQRVPVGPPDGAGGGTPHARTCGSAPPCRSPRCTTRCASPRRSPCVDVLTGGRINWGAGRGFELGRVRRLRRRRPTRPRPVPRGRRGRAGGVDERAAHVPRQVLGLRRPRGPARSRSSSRTRRRGWRRRHRTPSAGRRRWATRS